MIPAGSFGAYLHSPLLSFSAGSLLIPPAFGQHGPSRLGAFGSLAPASSTEAKVIGGSCHKFTIGFGLIDMIAKCYVCRTHDEHKACSKHLAGIHAGMTAGVLHAGLLVLLSTLKTY